MEYQNSGPSGTLREFNNTGKYKILTYPAVEFRSFEFMPCPLQFLFVAFLV